MVECMRRKEEQNSLFEKNKIGKQYSVKTNIHFQLFYLSCAVLYVYLLENFVTK